MKLIKTLVVLTLFGAGVLLGAKFYTKNQSDELSGTIDQLNPLVSSGEVYIKTKKADSVNDYGITTYKQTAFDESGQGKELVFTADHELKEERYLKIFNKGAHVETYEEVSQVDVPEKALAKLGN
ncbi:YxeA family protein [Enterococcus sp. 5H]|uniref:YxeA family protein n=1 Tax=Enterococcus sp. 5H TaxID=1229490 RepID=UPI0023037220|nr:YxeA family protein [Enterococcus sp. 5H]MDA9470260.1 hypothetical protein [Enterococcus sp. 5H]